MRKTFLLFFLFLAVHQLQAQIDMATSKKILALLPPTMKSQNANAQKDKVIGAKGRIGVTIHRQYGAGNNNVYVEVIDRSPSTGTVKALLAQTPNNNQYAVTEIDGYKALVQKFVGETGATYQEVLIPINGALLAMKARQYTQEEAVAMARTIPVAQIAKLIK